MDDWRILAWMGERTRPRVQRLAPAPSALKALLGGGRGFGADAETSTRGRVRSPECARVEAN